MLFPISTFKNFTKHEIVDTKLVTEVLFSIDAESKEEVDDIAKRAVMAGGTIFGAACREPRLDVRLWFC